ncbi:hypothetical protein [Rhodanobacter sp. 7MK24]|uniref:antibiotic biosynthesis monooxygenase family protein n=1 Tax=Rhodanobacter sp. 7MK24 TaxID=2775922 RepID=UPI001CE19547|nr:hypothetical protein [Rhodanobacter sp. 7MK24]
MDLVAGNISWSDGSRRQAACRRRWQENTMICRIWHGITPRSKADAYAGFLERRAIPDYRSVPGNRFVAVLRRDDAEVTHFMTVTHWDSEESIRAFAGDELLKAKYYPEDRDYLLEFEPLVQHFVMVAAEGTS